jgi:hypothetical protein
MSERLFVGIDAAVLPSALPPCDVVCGYVESPAASNVWSGEEWSRAAAHAKGRIPIHVAPTHADAHAAVAYGAQLCNDARNLSVEPGCVVVADVEHYAAASLYRAGYVQAWALAVRHGGYHPVVYCSVTDAPLFAPFCDVWGAHWGQPPVVPAGLIALQYDGGIGHAVDVSVWRSDAPISGLTNGGNGPMPSPHGIAIAIQHTRSGKGYWQVFSDGHVDAFGDAPYHGGANAPNVLDGPATGFSATPDGTGYVITNSTGGVFCFGHATYYGGEHGGVVQGPK